MTTSSMARQMTEPSPTGDLTELLVELRAINESGRVASMLQSMSVRPNLMRAIWQTLCNAGNDRLTPAQHDLIAQYVAAQTQAATTPGPVVEDRISPQERALLDFVGELLQQPYMIAEQHLRQLQQAGWTDTQIAEAVYDASLFQLLGRIDAAFPSGRSARHRPVGTIAA